MDDKAINTLANMAIAETQFDLGRTAVALPSGMQLHDLERFHPHRRSYRGTMNTSSIDSFAMYVNLYSTEHLSRTSCFIDEDDMSATTIFDCGTVMEPGHAEHRATLTLKPTAAFSAFNKQVVARACTQREIVNWLSDWREHLMPMERDQVDQGEKARDTMPEAIAALRDVKIDTEKKSGHEVTNFGNTKGKMEKIEADRAGRLPWGFSFSCIPYRGLAVRHFLVQLVINPEGDFPTFFLRPVHLESSVEDMAIEFEGIIRERIEDVETYLGKYLAG